MEPVPDPVERDQGFALAKVWKGTADRLAAEKSNLQAKIERYERALRGARKELSKWGYGDMHYASTPVQEESVRVTIRAIDAALAAPTEEKVCGICGYPLSDTLGWCNEHPGAE